MIAIYIRRSVDQKDSSFIEMQFELCGGGGHRAAKTGPVPIRGFSGGNMDCP